MVIMAREMLKLRKGDSAIMIKADGSMEVAGVNDKPLIDGNGRLSPIILFAAAYSLAQWSFIHTADAPQLQRHNPRRTQRRRVLHSVHVRHNQSR